MGKTFEMETYELLKQIDDTLMPAEDPFAPFDFVSEKSCVELKSRTFEMAKYPTTIVGTNKVRLAEADSNKSYYFVFRFTDGVFYIKYNKTLFAKFKKGKCERTDRGKSEVMEVLHIPIANLIRIHKRNPDGTFTVRF